MRKAGKIFALTFALLFTIALADGSQARTDAVVVTDYAREVAATLAGRGETGTLDCLDCNEVQIPNGGTCLIMPGVGPESTYTHGDSYNTSGEWAGVRHNNGECGSCEDRHWECIPPEVPAALELAFGQRPESDLISDRAALLDSTIRSYRRILKLVGRSLEVQLSGGETVHVSVPHAMLEMTARLLVE